MTVAPLAHKYETLLGDASETAGVSESSDQLPSGTKLPDGQCVGVCGEKRTSNFCSSLVTADKIRRH